jgi:hypothetical protein
LAHFVSWLVYEYGIEPHVTATGAHDELLLAATAQNLDPQQK